MTRTIRRIIYWIFTVIFLGAAPIILLMSAGYRLDLKTFHVEKTGLLVVNTADRDVQISINNHSARGVWRNKQWWFQRLSPGLVRVRVKKDGTTPWEKAYWVQGGITTFTSPVVLFTKSAPKKIAEGIFRFLPTQDLRNSATLVAPSGNGKETIWQYTKNGTLQPLLTMTVENNASVNAFIPSRRSRYALVGIAKPKGSTSWSIFEHQGASFIPAAHSLISAPSPEPVWSTQHEERLYGYDGNALIILDVKSGKMNRVLATPLPLALTDSGGTLFLLSDTKTDTTLFELDTSDKNPKLITRATLPSGAWSFLPSPQGWVTIFDAHAHHVVVYDQHQESQWTRTPIEAAAWNENAMFGALNDKLLYLWDAADGTTQTTALAQNVLSIILPKTLPIALLADTHTIRALERSDPEPLETTIASLASITDVRLDRDTKTLLITGSDDTGAGVFTYELPE